LHILSIKIMGGIIGIAENSEKKYKIKL